MPIVFIQLKGVPLPISPAQAGLSTDNAPLDAVPGANLLHDSPIIELTCVFVTELCDCGYLLVGGAELE